MTGVIEDAGWELRWPPTLLTSEGRWLLRPAVLRLSDWRDRVEHLLEEAFVGSEARDVFSRTPKDSRYENDPFGEDPEDLDGLAFLKVTVEAVGRFRPEREVKPYWPERQRGSLAPPDVYRRFVQLVDDMRVMGYLDQELPWGCVDGGPEIDPSPVLEQRLGIPDLWPLDESRRAWGDDTFYGLIEVIHDLVSRPRHRSYHSYSDCGWHWSEFARGPGQALYRWRVNRLLEHSDAGLRLADDGEDVGRLVASTDAARAGLATNMAGRTDLSTGDRIRHALALFRARTASEHDKRSAIVTLAGVLEERRNVLKVRLRRKDEGALFQIANQFALRHQGTGQQADYDPVFLDWVFWWYLATIELSDRLIERTDATPP